MLFLFCLISSVIINFLHQFSPFNSHVISNVTWGPLIFPCQPPQPLLPITFNFSTSHWIFYPAPLSNTHYTQYWIFVLYAFASFYVNNTFLMTNLNKSPSFATKNALPCKDSSIFLVNFLFLFIQLDFYDFSLSVLTLFLLIFFFASSRECYPPENVFESSVIDDLIFFKQICYNFSFRRLLFIRLLLPPPPLHHFSLFFPVNCFSRLDRMTSFSR